VYFFAFTVLFPALLMLIPTGCCVETYNSSTAGPTGDIAHISEIHFDPFYDATLVAQLIKADAKDWESIFKTSKITDFGTVNQSETNYNLLVSFLEDMSNTSNRLDFIIFTGDFIAHDFIQKFTANRQPGDSPDDFILKTFTFMASMFNKYFPDTPVYFALGNNDSYSGDYAVKPGGTFLKDTAALLSDKLLKSDANRKMLAETYPQGGYYKIIPPGTENNLIISLNSILFSVNRSNPAANDPAEKELIWFEEELKKARRDEQKVWLLLQAPPGANVFASVQTNSFRPFWKEKYNTRFIELLEAYASEITASFCGHTHMDDFRLLLDTQTKTKAVAFISICPAISPQFGNNPGYRRMTYSRQLFALKDYVVYYLDTEITDPTALQWQEEYTFSHAYGQTDITVETLFTLYNSLDTNPELRKTYMTFYNVSNKKSPRKIDTSWKAYWCGIANWTQTDFNICVGNTTQQPTQ
jgi:predicted MPP superfamily phosphohydrolase